MPKPDAIIEWIEANLQVVSGDNAGQPVRMLEWAKRFIRGAMRPGVTTSAISMARGNAKSSVCSYVASAALWGPLARKRSTIVCVASSLEQSRIIFDQVCYNLPDGGIDNKKRWRSWDSANAIRITDRKTGCTLKCLSSDPKTAHGIIPHLILADEPAQWKANRADKMINALITSAGKQPNAKVVFLGTRPENPDHGFSRLLDGGADYALEYRSRAKKTWFSASAMRAANPAVDRFPVLKKQIEKERQVARRDPVARAQYFAYRLNAGTPETVDQRDVLLTAEQFKALEGRAGVSGRAYVLGIDLSSSWAQSGFAAVSFDPDDDGKHHCDTFAVWPAVPDLVTRGQADGVEYRRMVDAGELVIVPGRTVPVKDAIDEAFSRWGTPEIIVCDHWRLGELQDVLEPYGFFEGDNLVTRRAGWHDGGADVSGFMRMALDRKLLLPKSDLLRYSMAAARVISDGAGNTKLAKAQERTTKGRDDAVSALVLAAALVYRQEEPAATDWIITNVAV